MKKKLVIFCGGLSSEHDVSVITALQFLEKIDSEKYESFIVYISRENRFFTGNNLKSFEAYRNFEPKKHKEVCLLPNNKTLFAIKNKRLLALFEIDFAINCCHGGIGENGILSGIWELSGIFSSSPICASMAICMDKVATKNIVEQNGINVVEHMVIDAYSWKFKRDMVSRKIAKFGFPIVVKPARQGSSVGVVFVKSQDDVQYAIKLAFEYDNKILIERAIVNKREFNCSCIGTGGEPLVSEVEEPSTSGVILRFEDKYTGGGKGKLSPSGGKSLGMEGLSRKFPADIPQQLSAMIKHYSRRIFNILELSGVVRIDYIFDTSSKTLYFSEVNSVPGSMSTYFWTDTDIVAKLIEGGVLYWSARKRLKNEYSVSLLKKK